MKGWVKIILVVWFVFLLFLRSDFDMEKLINRLPLPLDVYFFWYVMLLFLYTLVKIINTSTWYDMDIIYALLATHTQWLPFKDKIKNIKETIGLWFLWFINNMSLNFVYEYIYVLDGGVGNVYIDFFCKMFYLLLLFWAFWTVWWEVWNVKRGEVLNITRYIILCLIILHILMNPVPIFFWP